MDELAAVERAEMRISANRKGEEEGEERRGKNREKRGSGREREAEHRSEE